MLLRLQNATAAMKRMMRQQERVANNLANANTVGYKRDRIFTEALNERLDAEGAPRSDRLNTQASVHEEGPVEKTGNPLDVALGGEGFFVVNEGQAGAPRYTRAGHFVTSADGTLQTPQGHAVQGTGGPIRIPPEGGPVEIAKNGEVKVGDQRVGKLRVVRFNDPAQLNRLDGTLFTAGGQAPEDVEQPMLLQGHLEGSNVNPVEEMTDMIKQFRLFESQQKMLRSADQTLGQANQKLGSF